MSSQARESEVRNQKSETCFVQRLRYSFRITSFGCVLLKRSRFYRDATDTSLATATVLSSVHLKLLSTLLIVLVGLVQHFYPLFCILFPYSVLSILTFRFDGLPIKLQCLRIAVQTFI